MDKQYCRTLRKSLTGEKPVDHQTYHSVEVLSERLERLKKLGGPFARVEFSEDVRSLRKQSPVLAV